MEKTKLKEVQVILKATTEVSTQEITYFLDLNSFEHTEASPNKLLILGNFYDKKTNMDFAEDKNLKQEILEMSDTNKKIEFEFKFDRETIEKKIKDIVKFEFPPETKLDFSIVEDSGRLIVEIVSRRFIDMSFAIQQQLCWTLMTKHLKPTEVAAISSILTRAI